MFKFSRLIGVSRGLRKGPSGDGILSYISRSGMFRGGAEEVFEEYLARKILGYDDSGWEEAYTEILESTIQLASRKYTGQATLIEEDMIPAARKYCEYVGKDFDPEKFIRAVENELGDDKYNAVDEIIPETAEILYEVNQQIYGGYGSAFAFGAILGAGGRGRSRYSSSISRTHSVKRYKDYLGYQSRNAFSTRYKPGTVYGNDARALQAYQARATAKYGSDWNSRANSLSRSRASINRFLSQYPNGRPVNPIREGLEQRAIENRMRP